MCHPKDLPAGNYLRVRGEYPPTIRKSVHAVELPPRARRIPDWEAATVADPGTTSACAENTVRKNTCDWIIRNYLRVRGEYSSSTILPLSHWELPPRARRILTIEEYAAAERVHPSLSGVAHELGVTVFMVEAWQEMYQSGTYARFLMDA